MTSNPGTVAQRVLPPPAATVWGYARHEMLFLSFALMEIALLTPVVLVVLGWARYWPPGEVTLWLLLTMLLPLNLVRLMTLLHFRVARQRRVLAVSLLLLVLLSWRQLLYTPSGLLDLAWLRQFAASLAESNSLIWARDLSVFLVILFVWWRGIRLAGRTPELNNAGLRLRLGGLIFAPLIVWFSSSFLRSSVVPFILLFFLAASIAVALVRAETIEQEERGTAATLNARWFTVVASAAAGIVLVAGVAAAFLSGNSLYAVLAWLSPLWHALQFGGTVLFAVLFELVYPVFEALALIVAALARFLTLVLGPVAATLRDANLLSDVEATVLPTPAATSEAVSSDFTGKVVTTVVMLGLIVLVGLALGRVYQRATFAARQSARSRAGESAEDDAPGLGRRVLERLGLLGQWRTAASIRRIYRLMCRAAAAAGYPRLEVETPFEYLPTVSRVWPDYHTEVRLITEAFVRARYGEVPETREELDMIRAAWRRLESAEPRRRDAETQVTPLLTKRE